VSRTLLNLFLFQFVWWTVILGVASGHPWLGPLVILPATVLHLRLSKNRRAELRLLLTCGLVGFCFDTLLMTAGLFAPRLYLFPHPFSPLWMITLWLNLATTLNVSLAWLHKRPLLAVLLGGIGGPLSYYGGAKLGAAAVPTFSALLVLAVGWAILTPLLLRVAQSGDK